MKRGFRRKVIIVLFVIMILLTGVAISVVDKSDTGMPTNNEENDESETNDEPNSDSSTIDNSQLKQIWNQEDDFPNKENVNHRLDGGSVGAKWYLDESSGISPSPTTSGSTNTTFGITYHRLGNVSDSLPGENRWIADIESSSKFDVYVINANHSEIVSELSRNPSAVEDYSKIDEYSREGVREYEEVIEVNSSEYSVVYAVSNEELPNGESLLEYEGQSIEIDGYYTSAKYISYQSFRSNPEVQEFFTGKSYTE